MGKLTDVIIIGAGHNGLVAAGYLTRAGYSVHLVEARHCIGGAAITEEFYPGFRNSICSYVVSLLNPVVIKDLELEHYGLEIMDRAEYTLIPTLEADGGHYFPADETAYMDKVRSLSELDAENYEAFEAMLEMAAETLRGLVLETPPNLGGGLLDLLRAGKFANQLRNQKNKKEEKRKEKKKRTTGNERGKKRK